MMLPLSCYAGPLFDVVVPALFIAVSNSAVASGKRDVTVSDAPLSNCGPGASICQAIEDRAGLQYLSIVEKRETITIDDAIEEMSFEYQSQRLIVQLIQADGQLISVVNAERAACHGDSAADLVDGSLKITDQDREGYAEIYLPYLLKCPNSEAPTPMRLVVYDNGTKLSIKGRQFFFNGWIKAKVEETFMIDKGFKQQPKKVLDFATALWTQLLYDDKWGRLTEQKREKLRARRRALLDYKDQWY